ncbi:hypothetical protein HU200_001538 [Digitaria exilis]|uniref:t-SNARE coiled-coil homology domain-containing protein n=1 Tax=Digitaria exilis TaxID=1010633 RepID=A0A835G107_9POAL|nr:hypothetical protein HU200_001538 [Digitaria exilis]
MRNNAPVTRTGRPISLLVRSCRSGQGKNRGAATWRVQCFRSQTHAAEVIIVYRDPAASSMNAPPPSSPVDEWTKRFQEAERLVDDVAERIAERESVPPSLPRELQRRTAEIRRKVTILGTRLDMLQEDLSDLPKRQNIGLKQLGKLAEKLSGLSSKAKEVGGQFTMKYASDNELRIHGAEQDSQLEILEETIVSTKHIALAINEEVDLQTRLIDDLDERVEDTSTQLERALKRLKKLNMRVRKGDSCWGILLAIIAAVICVVVVWVLITIKG